VTNVNLSPGYQFDQGYDEYLYLPPDYFFGARESSSKLAGYSILRLLRERFIVRHKKVAHYYQDGQAVTEIAREWLDRHAERRFFLFLHYMDPHDPYFRHPYDGEAVARVHTPRPAPDRAKELSDLYDGEIRYLDRHLGELVSFLKERGLYDETLIVLTSDHGEEFHEHGGWWHGTTLYDEQIRVPLILKHAGNGPAGHSPGSRIAGVARLLDVAPTILDLAGLEAPPAMQGVSLARSTPGKESFSEEDFEGNRLRSLRGATWKLIEANSGNPRGLPEQALFDLAVDPGEAQNLAERESMRAKAMQGRMDHTMGAALKAAVTGEKVVIDATTRERLKALGYVE
jgi:arylsulfatase A-like enzyme